LWSRRSLRARGNRYHLVGQVAQKIAVAKAAVHADEKNTFFAIRQLINLSPDFDHRLVAFDTESFFFQRFFFDTRGFAKLPDDIKLPAAMIKKGLIALQICL
jgi:hypothetical protein